MRRWIAASEKCQCSQSPVWSVSKRKRTTSSMLLRVFSTSFGVLRTVASGNGTVTTPSGPIGMGTNTMTVVRMSAKP